MSQVSENQTEMSSNTQIVNVVNINNFNSNIFNIVGTNDVINQKPMVKTPITTEFDNLGAKSFEKGLHLTEGVTYRSGAECVVDKTFLANDQQKIVLIEAPTHKSLDFLTHQKYQDYEHTIMWGHLTILFTFISFIILTFWMFGSKFLPVTGNPIIDFMREDYHYCTVIPLLYPVFFIFIYKNWSAMKAFRHN